MMTGRDAHMVAPGRMCMGLGIEMMRVAIEYDFLALHVGRRTGTRGSGVTAERSLFGQI